MSYYGDLTMADSASRAHASVGDVATQPLGDIAIFPRGDTAFVPLYTPARDAPISVGEGAVAVPPPRMDPAPFVTEPYRLAKSPQTIQAWRTHVQPSHSEHMPPVNIQSWGIAHERPWETSSELVVHTTYTTPNLGGESFFTRDIVTSDVASTYVSAECTPKCVTVCD